MDADLDDSQSEARAKRAQLMKAAFHPVRAKALSMMAGGPTSPKEIAEAVDLPIGNVAYHVRELSKAGLVKLVEERKRGGATEHFYLATTVSDDQHHEMSSEERELQADLVLHSMIGDAAQAVEAGTLIRRSDAHLSRIPLYVDEQGWQELTEIFDRVLDDSLRVLGESWKRANEGSRERFCAFAALLLFEMPDSAECKKMVLDREGRPLGGEPPPIA